MAIYIKQIKLEKYSDIPLVISAPPFLFFCNNLLIRSAFALYFMMV